MDLISLDFRQASNSILIVHLTVVDDSDPLADLAEQDLAITEVEQPCAQRQRMRNTTSKHIEVLTAVEEALQWLGLSDKRGTPENCIVLYLASMLGEFGQYVPWLQDATAAQLIGDVTSFLQRRLLCGQYFIGSEIVAGLKKCSSTLSIGEVPKPRYLIEY